MKCGGVARGLFWRVWGLSVFSALKKPGSRRLLEQVLRVVDLLGIEEAVQLADTRRVTHLAQRLGLDLPDAFAGNLELLADFLERAAVAVHEAEAQREHATLALGERVEYVH